MRPQKGASISIASPVEVLLLFATSAIGGAERSLTRMALSTPQSDVRYTLATLGAEGDWTCWARSLGAQAQALGGQARCVPRLASLWRTLRPDFIYVMGLRTATLVRLLRPFMPRTQIVHGIRCNVDAATPVGRNYKLVEWPQRFLTDWYIANAQITRRNLAQLISVSPDRIDVVYNGIDVPDAPVLAWRDRAQEVVVVANLARRKGHIAFLAAVSKVIAQMPDVRFRFVGRDDMNGDVARAVQAAGLEPYVILHGYDRHPERWVAQAQMLVLHSLWGEGCPTAILEALSLGTPVVSYATDGVPELINHGQDGLLVPPQNAAHMADAILTLLRAPETAAAYGRTGRTKVMKQFTMAASARAHADIFSRLSLR